MFTDDQRQTMRRRLSLRTVLHQGESVDESTADNSANPVVRSMKSAIGRESTTFGFSILITVTFGMTQSIQGSPHPPQIFLYAFGGAMSFTVLEGVLSKGFRRPMPQHATQTMTLGTSVNAVSVLAGLLCAWGFANVTGELVAWTGAPWVAGLVYLTMESLEEAIAERLLVRSGDDDARHVTNQDE